MPNPYISGKLFDVLEALSEINNRIWFEEINNRFEDDVCTPLLSLLRILRCT